MRRNHADVALVVAISVLGFAAAIVRLPAPVTIVLGIGLFAAPGYVWSEVLLGTRVAGLERVAVATGLALAVPVFGGLALYAAGIPLHRAAWAGLLAGMTVVGAVVLTILRRTIRPGLPSRQSTRRRLPVQHAVTFGAAVVIAIGAVALARLGAEIQKYPSFTQLWLSPRGSTPLTASLGVRNQQGSTARYRMVLLRKGRVSTTWNLTLIDGHTWQRTILFTDRYSIVADLYRLPDLAHPYRYVTNGAVAHGSLRISRRYGASHQ
jgi:hypothetical protein